MCVYVCACWQPSVGWCGRLSPCLRVQPWPGPPVQAGEPSDPPLPEPDPAIERLLALCTAAGPGSQPLLDEDADASQSSSASEEILSNQVRMMTASQLVGRSGVRGCLV